MVAVGGGERRRRHARRPPRRPLHPGPTMLSRRPQTAACRLLAGRRRGPSKFERPLRLTTPAARLIDGRSAISTRQAVTTPQRCSIYACRAPARCRQRDAARHATTGLGFRCSVAWFVVGQWDGAAIAAAVNDMRCWEGTGGSGSPLRSAPVAVYVGLPPGLPAANVEASRPPVHSHN